MDFIRVLVVDHDLTEAGNLIRRVGPNFSKNRVDRHAGRDNFLPRAMPIFQAASGVVRFAVM